MALPTRIEFFRDHLEPLRILPGAPQYADIGICVVCQEDFNDESYDIVSLKGCNHIFHRKCLIDWAESASPQRNACPSCRKRVYAHVPLSREQIGELAQEGLQDVIFASNSQPSLRDAGWMRRMHERGQAYPGAEVLVGPSTPLYNIGQPSEWAWQPQTWFGPPSFPPQITNQRERPHIEMHNLSTPTYPARPTNLRDFVTANFHVCGEFSSVRDVVRLSERYWVGFESGDYLPVQATGFSMFEGTAIFYRQ